MGMGGGNGMQQKNTPLGWLVTIAVVIASKAVPGVLSGVRKPPGPPAYCSPDERLRRGRDR